MTSVTIRLIGQPLPADLLALTAFAMLTVSLNRGTALQSAARAVRSITDLPVSALGSSVAGR